LRALKLWRIWENYTDSEFDLLMADRNSKRTPVNAHVQMALATTKAPKAIAHVVHKKICEESDCDLLELTQPRVSELVKNEMNAAKRERKMLIPSFLP
jgi:hypothetical protein